MLPSKYYSDMFPVNTMPVPVSITDPMLNSPYVNSNSRTKNPEYADAQKIKYMISDYYALVKEIDDWVGKILTKLDELVLAENTIVIFTSDHGEMLGAHGMREKNVFLEESAHVSLMIRFPERIKPETIVGGYVSNIDLYATILDYTGVTGPVSDGKSLHGLIDGTDHFHVKIEGIHVYDMFGQNIFSDFEPFTGQKTIDLPLVNGICLIKPIGAYPFQAQKVIVE